MAAVATGSQDVLTALRHMDQQFMRFAAAGDPVGLTECFYAADAQVLPPDRPPVCGHFEIAAFWRAVIAGGLKSLELDTTRVEVSGDLACAFGRYTSTFAPPDGEPTTNHGKYLVAYRRQPDGSWKAIADMFSSNGSAPA